MKFSEVIYSPHLEYVFDACILIPISRIGLSNYKKSQILPNLEITYIYLAETYGCISLDIKIYY